MINSAQETLAVTAGRVNALEIQTSDHQTEVERRFVTKDELNQRFEDLKAQQARIENKLDALLLQAKS